MPSNLLLIRDLVIFKDIWDFNILSRIQNLVSMTRNVASSSFKRLILVFKIISSMLEGKSLLMEKELLMKMEAQFN